MNTPATVTKEWLEGLVAHGDYVEEELMKLDNEERAKIMSVYALLGYIDSAKSIIQSTK